MGRSYHLIATGSKDQKVSIWKIKFETQSDKHQVESTFFDDHKAEVKEKKKRK